jgi:iron(III) transport system permease protein
LPTARATSSRLSPWTVASTAIAALLSVPLVAVVSSLVRPAFDVWAHLWRTQLTELVVNTLTLVAAVGAVTAVLGVGLAWLVVGHQFPGRAALESALILPLAVPAYVIGFAFLGFLDYTGPFQTALRATFGEAVRLPELRSGWGVATVMSLVFYPYVYLLARAGFQEQGAATLETARSLGRSRTRAFLEITLPMARPSIVAGMSLAMMEALADFGTVSTFGYRTLTEAIYRVWYGMFDRTAASQLASLLLFFALALLLLEQHLRGRARFVQSQRRGAGIRRRPLRGWRALAATGFCTAVLGVAFVLPVGQLVAWAIGSGGLAIPPRLPRLLASTVTVAAVAAATTAALALVLVYAGRLRGSRPVQLASRFVGMGYALPGSVIAVGILVPMAWLDHRLAHVAERLLGHPVGLLVTGTSAGLLFAYVVRFVAVSLQTLEASLGKIPGSFDDAARSLGAGLGRTLARIHLPLLRGGLMTALVLVFVETMKEMPATLLLRPFGLTTLAIEVWERTSESMWAEASAPALAIVLAGLVPVVIAMRLSARR